MRDDLYALTAETVAALANVGLVKRAQKEIEQGKLPAITESDDGTVNGTFDDAVVTRLLPGRSLRDAMCTCPASGACRHRVLLALAYRAFADAQRIAVDGEGAPAGASGPRVAERWTPGEFSDGSLRETVGTRVFADARSAVQRTLVVEVLRDEVPTARLPACTVRFLVPHALAWARCDCTVGQGCVHVVLASWAFRAADARDALSPSLAIDIGRSAARAIAKSASDEPIDAPVHRLLDELLAEGVVNAREARVQSITLVRDALERAGHLWPALALDDVALALARYRSRSARYRTSDVLALAVEIVARERAARAADSPLPPAHVLGRGESAETKMDLLRLMALGCRIDADGTSRTIEILLADPDSGTVLVYEREWNFALPEVPPEGPVLAQKRVAGATLAQLARGQIVTRVARRRANRVVVFGQAAHGSMSVTPQSGEFSMLAAPLRIDRFAELTGVFDSRPPRMIRPRARAEDVHVLRISAVTDVVLDPATQTLHATLHDSAGDTVHLARTHRAAVPDGLDALGRALTGEAGSVRWIAGFVRREAYGFEIEPTLVAADRVVVPDVDTAAPVNLRRATVRRAPDASGAILATAQGVLEEAVQLGLAGIAPSHDARTRTVITGLEAIGAHALARTMERFRVALEQRRNGAATDGEAVRALIDAGIAMELAREMRVKSD